MANNKSIQLLRGSDTHTNTSISSQEILDGQPLYDKSNGFLYMGTGTTIADTLPVNYKDTYNMGAYDTVTSNGDGTVTVTRKTGRYDVPIENFVVGEGCFQIFNFSLPNTDKYFITNGGSGSSDQATSNVYPLGAWGVDDTFYIPSDNYLRVFDSSYTKDATGLAQFKASLEAAGGMYILYETDTSYQEKLPANVSINTLDQNMTEILESEIEKTLNLYNHNDVSDLSGNVDTSDFGEGTIDVAWNGTVSNATINFDAKNGATFSCTLNSAAGGYWAYNLSWLYKDGSSERMTTNQSIGTAGNFTFSSAAKEVIGIQIYLNTEWSASNVMINEGSHAYPYQPYNGAIVHEKQLNDALEDYPTNDELNTKLEDYLPLTGGTMSGEIKMGGNPLNLGDTSRFIKQTDGNYVNLENANFNVVGGIVNEQGQRVYSPNNKQTSVPSLGEKAPWGNSSNIIPDGLTLSEVYNNGFPTSYGNSINLGGRGEGQVLVGWSGSEGSTSATSGLWYRSKRDNGQQEWSEWSQVYDTNNKPTMADIGLNIYTDSEGYLCIDTN